MEGLREVRRVWWWSLSTGVGSPVDTIYTFLFGPSGRRGLSVFCSTATALSGMILGHSSSDEEVSTITISSNLTVLDRLIEIN
jgi:hypothetical protein